MMNYVKKCTVSLLLLWNSQNIICAPKAVVPSSQNNNELSFATVVTPVVVVATGITLWKVYQQQKELQSCRDEIKKFQEAKMVIEQEFSQRDDLAIQKEELKKFVQSIKDEITNDVVDSLGRVIKAKDLVARNDFEVVMYDNGIVALNWVGSGSDSDVSSDSSGSTQEFYGGHNVE